MQVPSGRTFGSFDIEVIKGLHHASVIVWREVPFKLKSGVSSHVYVFGRNDLTENPDVLRDVGEKIARTVRSAGLKPVRQSCLIGIPTAGTALALAGSLADTSIACRIMREKKKTTHGANNTWVEGKPDHTKHHYWIVDNNATDGGSKFEAAKRLAEDGYNLQDVDFLIFIDRQQGAIKALAAQNLRVTVIYNLLDITYAFAQLELWPQDAADRVQREIAAHQLVK